MTNTTNHPAGNYAAVNGISLYYEVHGTGKPLIMLHGGFGSFEMFSTLSPTLASTHQVIGVDLYGHGRTALTDRPLRFEHLADDIVGLIEHLVILARDGRGKIVARIIGTRTTNKLQGALTTAREILQTTPPAVRIEVHLFEGYESPYRGKPLAVFSLADLADEEGDDEEEEL